MSLLISASLGVFFLVLSKLMKQIRMANPSLAQHQVLSMASKQLSRKKMASGLYLEPYRKGK